MAKRRELSFDDLTGFDLRPYSFSNYNQGRKDRDRKPARADLERKNSRLFRTIRKRREFREQDSAFDLHYRKL